MRTRSRIPATALAALSMLPALLAAPTTALAQQPQPQQQQQQQPAGQQGQPTVDELMRRGVDAREHGQDEAALAAFAQAWQAGHRAEARAQMALAEQALGRWAESEAHLNEALGMQDPWITRNRRALQGALTEVRRHVGSLDVLANAPGAEVRVGGVLVGTLPLSQPIRLAIGSQTIVVSAPGMRPVTRTVTIDATALARETVSLERDDGTAPAQPPPPAGGVPAATASCPAGQVVTPETAGHCCWVGQVWANVRQMCVGTPAACPGGTVPQGDACVAGAAPGPYGQPGAYGQPVYVSVGPPAPMVFDDSQEMTLSVTDGTGTFTTSVRVGTQTFACDAPLSVARPCRLRDVTPGEGRITFEGHDRIMRGLRVPRGRSSVVLHRRGYGTAVTGMVFGALSTVGFLATRSNDTGWQVVGWIAGIGFGVPGAIIMLEDLLRSRYELRVVDVVDDRTGLRRAENGLRFRGIAAAPEPGGGAVVLGAFTF